MSYVNYRYLFFPLFLFFECISIDVADTTQRSTDVLVTKSKELFTLRSFIARAKALENSHSLLVKVPGS